MRRSHRLIATLVATLVAVAPSAGAASSSTSRRASRYGVMVSGAVRDPAVVAPLRDLGVRWVRVNVPIGEAQPDVRMFLDAEVNAVLTIVHRDRSNLDTTYGTPTQWPKAGFPYRDRATFERELRDLLAPLVPSLDAGRRVWVQCENEIGDASIAKQSAFWRGTTDQYLTLLAACRHAARAVDHRFVVVMSSFASESLDAALDPANPRHGYAASRLEHMLRDGSYDAVDLHFYGCVDSIAAKVAWVDARRHDHTDWISTENSGPDPRCPQTPISWRRDLARFERVEAQQVPGRLRACVENGGAVCLWFSLLDLKHEVDTFNHLGLLDPRVSPPRHKPAYDAFRRFVTAA